MAKKNIFIILALALLIVSGYLVVITAFPEELNHFPIYVIGLLLDFYLWFSVRKWIQHWKSVVRYVFAVLYWLPFVAMVTIGITSLFVNVFLSNPLLTTYIGGTIFTIYAGKLIVVIFFMLADLIKIIRHTVRFTYHKSRKKPCPEKGRQITRANFLQKLGLLGGGLVLSGMVIGAVRWAYDFRIRRVNLRYPVLPRELEGIRILQISDLHLGSWTNSAAMEEAVDLINDEHADLVFFTGDLVNFQTSEAYRYKDQLKRIRARYGVYAVLGNHDYGDYVKWDDPRQKENNLTDLVSLYREMGWRLLRNENKIVQMNDIPVAVVGVENWSSYERCPSYGDLDLSMKGTGNSLFKILLSHDPTHWERVVSQKHPDINLTLSGHTHGFQFGVELKNFRWSPAQYMYKQWAGLYENPATDTPQYIYVNRGLGMIGYPGRIGILPEITVLELTREA